MLDGRTNIWERLFEVLFKGVGTRFGRRPFEKWFPRAEHGNMQLRNLSSNLQLRDLRQCDYLANYKIYITDSVVVCCTGSETRPILSHHDNRFSKKPLPRFCAPRVDPFRRSGGIKRPNINGAPPADVRVPDVPRVD